MATLKANGPELLRISRQADTPDDKSVSWRRTTIVYHANGVVLQKIDVRFRPTASFDPPEGRFYSWGWKKIRAAKDNPKPFERATKVLASIPPDSGWEVEFSDRRIKAIAPTDPKYLAPEVQS